VVGAGKWKMNCAASTTGLITNGSGGYLNANGGIGMNFINAGMLPQQSVPIDYSTAASSMFISAPVSVADINNASNSYTDGAGNPVMANPNLPAVTQAQCESIKCGATQGDEATLFACSQSFGAGVWDLCGDARCAPYRGASCPTMSPTPTPLAVQFPNQPLTPASLTAPIPDITTQLPGMGQPQQVGPDALCSFSQWVNNNPLLACAALVGVFMLVKK